MMGSGCSGTPGAIELIKCILQVMEIFVLDMEHPTEEILISCPLSHDALCELGK
jgi:hypothetical protein